MRLYALSLICLIAIVLSASVSMANERLLLTNGEWPPLTSENLKNGGLFSQICSEAFALEGISVEYVYMPWIRAMEYAQKGKFAGSVAWRKAAKWEVDFLYSNPVYVLKTVFFHRMGTSFDWETLDDVKNLRIGATRGYLYLDILLPYVEAGGGKLDIGNSDLANIKMLAEGRIDLFPCAEEVGHYLIRKELARSGVAEIRAHEKQLMRGEIYLLISRKQKGGKAIVAKFNKGLCKLRESGRYDQILRQWSTVLHRAD